MRTKKERRNGWQEGRTKGERLENINRIIFAIVCREALIIQDKGLAGETLSANLMT